MRRMRRMTWAAALMLTAGLAAGDGSAGDPADGVTAGRVDDLAARAKPAAPEPWEAIPWAPSLSEARAAGRREQCPVFLFHLQGDMGRNRC